MRKIWYGVWVAAALLLGTAGVTVGSATIREAKARDAAVGKLEERLNEYKLKQKAGMQTNDAGGKNGVAAVEGKSRTADATETGDRKAEAIAGKSRTDGIEADGRTAELEGNAQTAGTAKGKGQPEGKAETKAQTAETAKGKGQPEGKAETKVRTAETAKGKAQSEGKSKGKNKSKKKAKAKKEAKTRTADTKSPEKADSQKLKTAYVGDSILHSLLEYDLVKDKAQKVIAKIGLSPFSFYNNEIMDEVIKYKADRIFIMLGLNAIEGDPGDRQMRSAVSLYKKIIQKIQKEDPGTEIVVLPVGPVQEGAPADNRVINAYNRRVKAMAADLGTRYYNYTSEMKERNGCLKDKYADADGEHWTKAGCRRFLELAEEYADANN